MNKYGQIAIRAVEYISKGFEAENAWEFASCEFYKKGSSPQKKGCPKNAFLGLFSRNPRKAKGKNAMYANKAVSILRNDPTRKFSTSELWALVIADETKTHNAQMDVVLALWDKRLIS